ncbi:MAG: hypothetical protein SGI90_16165 [Candidatus Eisenbacteria bacterium]|nr:hypothetical protein [Candidatus Eisenbacteria bacterium]
MTLRTEPTALLPLLLAVALFLSLDRPKFEPSPTGQKPMFPVSATLAMINRPEAGGVARLVATITAWAPGEVVEWRLERPAALTLVDGPESWSGQLSRGESRSFELAFLVPDEARHEVSVRAWLPERPRATSAASQAIDLGRLEGLRATGTTAIGDGETYLQYQGEVTPREVMK